MSRRGDSAHPPRTLSGYCYHRDVDRVLDVDEGDVLYEYCVECTKTWLFGKVNPSRAAAVRRANGREPQ